MTPFALSLAPFLQKQGFALTDRGGDNFEVHACKGLLIKASFWRWPERGQAGNSIDFLVKVLGLPFHDAMIILTKE